MAIILLCLRLYIISMVTFVHTQFVQAHTSSGRLIIETAKKAIEEALHRQKRETSVESFESLLLAKPENSHLVEFDLLLDDDQFGTIDLIGPNKVHKHKHDSRLQKRKAVKHSIYYWPGAVVPYEIHSSIDTISPVARQRIKKAMTHWERHTCIKFVEYNANKHFNYLSIQKGQWCASKLGMAGGVQPLYVAYGCLDTGTIIHELGHTIGWVHEQARPDRDDYITINWSLVSASYRSQYIKHSADFVDTYGIPYDYDSIMHYPSYGELVTKDSSAQHRIGQRNRLSFHDIKLANAMYKCAERSKCDTTEIECINGGFIDHTCECVCPDGDSKSCRVTNGIFDIQPKVKTISSTLTQPSPPACEPWKSYDNAYISGYNDDVGFSLTVEQCQERCIKETSFKCLSFDYWKQRKQCYLSSASAALLNIRFTHDTRMVHYALNECVRAPSTTLATTTMSIKVSITQGNNATLNTANTTNGADNSSIIPVTSKANVCPFEYVYTGISCIRPLKFPLRPVHIATMECEHKLSATLWDMQRDEILSTQLSSAIGEGEEYWVSIKNFKSNNVMAGFFEFCPYITKEKGVLTQKDTLCYKQKGFVCQLQIK